MDIYFCSFADSRMSASLSRIKEQALAFDMFKEVYVIDENGLDSSFRDHYKDKLILPIDVVTDLKECFITDITNEEKGLDIGPKTVKLFKQYLDVSKTVIWNGPVGMFEDEKYSGGTKGICEILRNIKAIKIAGGGDTASAIKQFGYDKIFTHISTGGGASLELLEGKVLPGIEVIK